MRFDRVAIRFQCSHLILALVFPSPRPESMNVTILVCDMSHGFVSQDALSGIADWLALSLLL